MKKLFKILGITFVTLVVLLVATLAILRWVYPDAKLKQMALNYTKKAINREISFDHVSIGLKGITLDNFALSAATTFEQGTFIKADKLQVWLAWRALLRKRIQISTLRLDGLDVTIIQNADGSFNFEDATKAKEENTPEQDSKSTEDSLGFALTAKHFVATNCRFTYEDKASGTTTGVDKINLDVRNFDLKDPFNAIITFTTQIDQKNTAPIVIPSEFDLTVSLADLNMQQAYATLNKASASYKTVALALTGKVENFENPNVQITGTISGISNKTFSDFLPDLPNFTLPVISLALNAQADTDQGSAQIERAEIRLQDSLISASGPIDWSGKRTTYNFTGKTNINIEQAVQMTDTVDVRPTGTISGNFKATDKNDYQDFSGTFILKNVSLIYEPFTLTQTNGTVQINSLQDISSQNLAGLLNGEKLTVSFSYKEVQDVPTIVLDADLAKLHLEQFSGSSDQEKKDSTSEETPKSATPADESSKPETFFNLKANIKMGEITIPYVRSEGLTLNADLTNLSSSMVKTDGLISFQLQPGAITDIDRVIKGNKIVRLILLPLDIINSVAGKLNISLFEAASSARKGEIELKSGEGEYAFKNGLMTINNTSFISNLTDIKGKGTINFPTNELDMKVSASILSKQTPVVIKISGTLDNPSGKLDVLNTVSSVVGGLLNYKIATGLATGTVKTAGNVASGAVKTAGNVASGAVKTAGNVASGAVKTTGKTAGAVAKTGADAIEGTVKAIGSLFKKKKEDPNAEESKEEVPSENIENTDSPQENADPSEPTT